MNRIYRLVWSHVHKVWVPVAKITRGRSKGSNRKLLMAPLFLFAAAGQAEPLGGQHQPGRRYHDDPPDQSKYVGQLAEL